MTMKKFYVGVKGVIQDSGKGILLLHRDYKSGDFWDTPGGRIDADEEFAETLKRELSEELPGIEVKSIGGLLGAFRLQKDIDGDTCLVLLYFAVEAKLPESVVLSEEHKSYKWINSVADIPNGLNQQIEKILRKLLQ